MADNAATFEFFATCAAGFEQLLAGELSSLAITSARPLHGQVAFTGTLADAYRACLWSRIASRVVMVLAHIDAPNSDVLYQNLVELPWEEHIALTATFAVDAHGTNDELRNTQFVALRSKDAICDRLQAKLGARPNVETHNPDVSVVVRLRGSRATVGIDFSGEPLFHRGYASSSKNDGLVGLRADYAAALLAAGGWYRLCRKEAPVLVSMYAGAGTLAVEALSVAFDRAPGLNRLRWGFMGWRGYESALWEKVHTEATERAEAAEARGDISLVALDERVQASSALKTTLRSAGFATFEPVVLKSAESLDEALKGTSSENTLALADLSWVLPDEQAQEVAALGFMRTCVAQLHDGCTLGVLEIAGSVAKALNLEATQSFETMLGRNTAQMSLYTTSHDTLMALPHVILKDGTNIPVMVSASDQFAARLTKVAKLRRKWATKEDVTCYRVFDADLPDYAVAIDVYQASDFSRRQDAGASWLVIQEYAAPKSVDPALAHARLLDVLALAPVVLGVSPQNVYVRVRSHAKGGSQYADGGRANAASSERGARSGQAAGRDKQARAIKQFRTAPGAHLIDEGGLTFEVNFSERLDTGIFLDHRDVRAEVREMAKKTLGSKRFLNLFAYTGTATCYAADGGAKHTTTVDLSATYLEWAQRNMAHNGFVGPEHEFVRADVVRWISEQRHTANRWDLVFCDPPTFSNSKRMGRDVFDVQRDHAELLIGISRLLTRNGVCLFSCNLRGFKPDTEKLNRAGVQIEDITAGTIPEDFSRNAKIHHCYLVRRTPRES